MLYIYIYIYLGRGACQWQADKAFDEVTEFASSGCGWGQLLSGSPVANEAHFCRAFWQRRPHTLESFIRNKLEDTVLWRIIPTWEASCCWLTFASQDNWLISYPCHAPPLPSPASCCCCCWFRATSHMRLRARDPVTLQALWLVEKAEPVQLRCFNLRLRDRRSMWNARWMWMQV